MLFFFPSSKASTKAAGGLAATPTAVRTTTYSSGRGSRLGAEASPSARSEARDGRLSAGCGGEAGRGPLAAEECAGEGALLTHAEETPPPAAARRSRSRTDSGMDAAAAHGDEEAEELLTIPAPAATHLAPEDEEAIGSASEELRIAAVFALHRRCEGDAVLCGRPGERHSIPRQGGDEGRIAAKSLAERGGAMEDKIQASSVGRAHPRRRSCRQPLLWHDAPLRPKCLPTDPDPHLFKQVAPTRKGTTAGACCVVIAVDIERPATAMASGGLAAVCKGQRQGKAETPSQADQHVVWWEGGSRVRGHGKQPCPRSSPGLRAKQGLRGRGQSRQQGPLAKGGEKREGGGMLPAMTPDARLGFGKGGRRGGAGGGQRRPGRTAVPSGCIKGAGSCG